MPAKQKKYAVIGAARSGIAVARLLRTHKMPVFVSDAKPTKTMKAAADALMEMGATFEFGRHTAKVQDNDVVVLSPGVPSDLPVVRLAKQRNMTVLSEIEIAYQYCPCDVIAITGTNGKTTTTALTAAICEYAGRKTFAAGNIGLAFSEIVDQADANSIVVLEVSSFQLDHIDEFRPKVSVLLNITPDHLDRYDSYEEYVQAKFRIAENQLGRDVFVYNHDDPAVRAFADTLTIKATPFSCNDKVHGGACCEEGMILMAVGRRMEPLMPIAELGLRGKHNVYNSMAAALAAKAMDIPTEAIKETLRTFKGVEHRIEFVRTLDGVGYYNDSKATNVDSVKIALESFTEPVILIAGGRDKGASYKPLFDLVKNGVKALVLIGEATEKIEKELGSATKCIKAGSMAEAVHKAKAKAAEGDVVLLSPACASYDMFDNFEHRGRVFKECVNALS